MRRNDVAGMTGYDGFHANVLAFMPHIELDLAGLHQAHCDVDLEVKSGPANTRHAMRGFRMRRPDDAGDFEVLCH